MEVIVQLCVCVCVCVCVHAFPNVVSLRFREGTPPVVDHTQCLFYRTWWARGRCLDKATSSHYMLVVAARGNRLPDRHDSHFLSSLTPHPQASTAWYKTLRFEYFTPHYGIKTCVMSFKRMKKCESAPRVTANLLKSCTQKHDIHPGQRFKSILSI